MAATAQAQVLARATVDSTHLTIGDQVWLRILISAPTGTEILAIDASPLRTNKQLEVLETQPPTTTARSPELLLEQRFRLTTFDTGYVRIPALPVVYRLNGQTDTTFTPDIPLRVSSILVTKGSELQPIKDIVVEPRNWTDWWPVYLALLVFALAVSAYMAWRRWQQVQVPTPPPPPVPPHTRALARLHELERQQLWQRGEVKRYQSELTHILRQYLEERFRLPALESTTREIEREIERRELLPATDRAKLGELLRMADMVKFAKAEPPADFHAYALQEVRHFVERTRPVEPAEPLSENS